MGYNFFVDSLGFNKAVSPDNPYQRATAPFKKDQVDNSATPGDNSLTGWWVRSQPSFHKGAGIDYYDVAETDTLYRFKEAYGCTIWTPGQVLPAPTGDVGTLPGSIIEAAPGDYNDIWSVDFYGTLYYWTAVVPTTTAGSAKSICADPLGVPGANGSRNIYVAVDNVIEKTSKTVTTGTTVLWTNNNAGNANDGFRRIAYAKDRLWAFDLGGNWYTLPTTGGTIAAGDTTYKFWTADSPWREHHYGSVAESPGPVFVSWGHKIYSVGVDQSGAVPVISTPVVAADLGPGTQVYSIAYSHGHLLICSSVGFQVAAIDSSGGLTLGPTFLPDTALNYSYMGGATNSSFIAKQMATLEGRAWVMDRAGNVFELNLLDEIATLQPPWTYVTQTQVGSTFAPICMLGEAGLQMVSSGNTGKALVIQTTTHVGVGTLTTGYHRFETLDNKQFYSVLLRLAGGFGTVKVSRVDADGTIIDLQAIDVSQTHDVEVPLGMTSAAERVALKFTLTPDSSDPNHESTSYPDWLPQLLGYQLKALPVPKRQRLIRVPVFMFDVEQDSAGKRMGRAKDAWTRLAALEAYEEANSIVTYRDDDTGETGTAYIESIETQVESTSSARASDRGFGGIVTITLRRIGD